MRDLAKKKDWYWQGNHREEHIRKAKINYQKNREKRLAQSKLYRQTHPDVIRKINERYVPRGRQRRAEVRQEILKKLGNVCVRCGFSDWRALQIDHINGGGIQDKKNLSQDVYHRKLLKMPMNELIAKYQLLCANCNWIKKYENNELPKKRTKMEKK